MKSTLNGYVYGNLNPLQGYTYPTKSKIRWYVISIGGGASSRSVQWNGHEISISPNVNQPILSVTTPGYAIGDMLTRRTTGTWMISSMNENEMEEGMTGTYEIIPSSDNESESEGDVSSLTNGGVVGIVIMSFLICCVFFYLLFRSNNSSYEKEENSSHSHDPLNSSQTLLSLLFRNEV